MSVWNKVLVGLILVLALVFFYLGGRTLKFHKQWREQAAELEQELAQQKAEAGELRGIGEPPKGIRQARLELHRLTVDRGRVWDKARPVTVQVDKDPATGLDKVQVRVANDKSAPKITPQTNLFIFDNSKAQRGWRYLGQFTVTQVADNVKEFIAVPARKLGPNEIQRLQESQGKQASWTMYEVMPVDDPELLATWDEKSLRALLPAASAEEYVKEGAKRKLRDYEVSFRELHRQKSQLIDGIAALSQDVRYLTNALAEAKQDEQAQRDRIQQMKAELDAARRELEAVESHRKALEAEIAATKQKIAAILESNRSAADKIARIQLEAARRMDEKTRRMAVAP